MQMKHFASCIGVNNIECKSQENEHEVVPFSCVSRVSVNMLGTSRRNVGEGVLRCSHVNLDLGEVGGMGPTNHEPIEAEQRAVSNTHVGSRNICYYSHCC